MSVAPQRYVNGEPVYLTELKVVRLSDVTAKPIVPICDGVLYRGKVTVAAGSPGCGKSAFATDIVARASVGGEWPSGGGRFSVTKSLLLTAEDDPEDTIRPRLDIAGADLTKVDLIAGAHRPAKDGEQTLDAVALLQDLVLIEAKIREASVGLLVIDPLTSFAGRSDTNKTGDTRRLLDALGQMAARTGVAVLVITHLNKRSDARGAMQMIAGSHVITAAVRVVLVTARDPQDRDRRLLLPVKINIDAEKGGFAFRIVSDNHPQAGRVPRVQWERGRVLDVSADEALVGNTSPRALARSEKVSEIELWLRQSLAAGPVPATTLKEEAKARGFGEKDVRKAAEAIGAKCKPPGYRQPWQWSLTESAGK